MKYVPRYAQLVERLEEEEEEGLQHENVERFITSMGIDYYDVDNGEDDGTDSDNRHWLRGWR